MDLLVAAVVSGIAVGLLYAMLGFSIVVLYRATGLVSFAQSNVAMFCTFVVYLLISRLHLGTAAAIAVGGAVAAALGTTIYALLIRPNSRAGNLNLAVRTLAIYTILFEIANNLWAPGQPFPFPSLSLGHSWHIGSATVVPHSVTVIGVVAVLGGGLAMFFRFTRTGLLFRAVADRPDIARMLGVNTGRLTAIAWIIAGVIALATGIMTAPVSFVSTDMMSAYVLYGFAGALVGGLNSWSGVFLGGVLVGVTSNVATVYLSAEAAVIAVFMLLLLVLVLRPAGMFGQSTSVRL